MKNQFDLMDIPAARLMRSIHLHHLPVTRSFFRNVNLVPSCALRFVMKHRLAIFATGLLPLMCMAQDQQSTIGVQEIGKDHYRLTLRTFRTTEVAAGQQELAPKALELCGSKKVNFGRYRFKSTERLESGAKSQSEPIPALELEQEITCGAASPEVGPPPLIARPPDETWRPTERDQQEVERLTFQYFAAIDEGRYRDGYAMLDQTNQNITPLERWSANAKTSNERAGEAGKRHIKKVTWYNNPRGAPLPGFYVAVDFDGAPANLAMYCGYLMWHRKPDGSYRLIREEQNMLDKKTRKKMTDEEFQQAKAKFRC